MAPIEPDEGADCRGILSWVSMAGDVGLFRVSGYAVTHEFDDVTVWIDNDDDGILDAVDDVRVSSTPLRQVMAPISSVLTTRRNGMDQLEEPLRASGKNVWLRSTGTRLVLGAVALASLLEAGCVSATRDVDQDGVAATRAIATDTLRVHELEVVNAAGRVVFSVSTDGGDAGVMQLSNQNGEPMAIIRRGDFGHPGLVLCSRDGSPLVILREGESVAGMLKIASQNGMPVFFGGADEHGNGELILVSKDGAHMRRISQASDEVEPLHGPPEPE